MRLFFTLFLIGLFQTTIMAQNPISGTVVNSSTGVPVEGAKVMDKNSLKSTMTNIAGRFTLDGYASGAKVTLVFSKENEVNATEKTITVPQGGMDLGNIGVEVMGVSDEIQTVTLDDLKSDDEDDDGGYTYSMLSSGRDIYLNAVRYGVGGRRFRVRGMDSENRIDYLNGMPINKMHDGRTDFYDFGGLNDVLRRQDIDFGLSPGIFSFGGTLGSWSVDTRASSQRRQKRVSYAVSNRSYRNRVMAVLSTGMLKNGLAMTVSASHRWGKQGYVAGTYYENSSYFFSVDKKVNKHHLLNLMVLGSPGKRGRSGVVVEEARELLGDNYYNPKWGYQQGKVRNSAVDNNHQPIVTFRHDWTIGANTTLTSTIGYQFGRSGRTRLNWQQAADPRPDYYHYLPSAVSDTTLRSELTSYLKAHPEAMQLNWNRMYQANYNSQGTVENANGIAGNTVTGKKARYFVEESRIDNLERSFNSVLEHSFSDKFGLNAGVTYRRAKVHYFNTVNDLLGADFVHDIDKYNVSYADPMSYQPDVNIPNKVAKEGDIIGYDYEARLSQANVWGQLKYTGKQVDVFGALQLSQNTMQRVGNMKNGHFQESSYGKGQVNKFNNYGVKGGLTYKLNGRNYLFINGYLGTRAPFFRDSYLSPRTREQLIDGLDNEQLTSVEGGYVLNAPYLKARLTGYYYTRENRTRTITFFADLSSIDYKFGSLSISGLNTRNVGTEVALETKITPTLTLTAVAAVGQHLITSRPHAEFTVDDNAETIDVGTVYWKNYRVSNSPQQVYSARLSYRSPRFWFASLTGGFSQDLWMDVSPIRKTATAVDKYTRVDDPGRIKMLKQEELPGAFTLDFFGGKSIKFGDNFLYFNLGVSNILNDTNIRTGGFEQLRVDPDRFPNKYFYSYGMTYFASVAWRF